MVSLKEESEVYGKFEGEMVDCIASLKARVECIDCVMIVGWP